MQVNCPEINLRFNDEPSIILNVNSVDSLMLIPLSVNVNVNANQVENQFMMIIHIHNDSNNINNFH